MKASESLSSENTVSLFLFINACLDMLLILIQIQRPSSSPSDHETWDLLSVLCILTALLLQLLLNIIISLCKVYRRHKFKILGLSDFVKKVMRTIFSFSVASSIQQPLLTSGVMMLLKSQLCLSRGFQNCMTLAYRIKNEVSRPSWTFESDLSKFCGKD